MNGDLNQILRKYLIMGSQNCRRDPLAILQEAIDGGITAFQYREKGKNALDGGNKLALGLKLRKLCREEGIPFFINDDIELADKLDVDGIHVGQEDIPVEQIRKKYPTLIIGLSVSNDAELRKSPIELVDYLGAGPVFPTLTKDDVKPVAGLEWIRRIKEQYDQLPVVGIGGINTGNASAVLQSGAQGVAVITAITHSENIINTVREL